MISALMVFMLCFGIAICLTYAISNAFIKMTGESNLFRALASQDIYYRVEE